MKKQILMAVGAHADDIEFNVGGTLCKYREAGYGIAYVMSTNNMSGSWNTVDADGTKHSRLPDFQEILPQRKKEAAAAAAFFGTDAVHLDHPQRHYTRKDGRVEDLRFGSERPDCVPENVPTILTAYEDKSAVRKLADRILDTQPEAVLSHGMVSGNIEHTASCLLVSNAFWRARQEGFEGMLLYWQDVHRAPSGDAYAVWDSFVDVSSHWREKLAAIAIHACQVSHIMDTLDFPSFTAETGCVHAEVFHIAAHCGGTGGAFSDEILRNRR